MWEVVMDSFNPNYFIHAANVLLLVAYSVRDILWLRLFAVAASAISLPYFVLQPTPQWPPMTGASSSLASMPFNPGVSISNVARSR